MNTTTMTQDEREHAVALLAAVRRQRDDLGGVVVGTGTVLGWARFAPRATRRSLRGIDLAGLHLARRALLHNDSEWRLSLLVKMEDTAEPYELTLDVSMDAWEQAEHETDLLIARVHDLLN